jgi:hypothetical protein
MDVDTSSNHVKSYVFSSFSTIAIFINNCCRFFTTNQLINEKIKPSLKKIAQAVRAAI